MPNTKRFLPNEPVLDGIDPAVASELDKALPAESSEGEPTVLPRERLRPRPDQTGPKRA